MSAVSIEDLPPELLMKIFDYLPAVDLLKVQDVCTKWKVFAQRSSLWENFVYSPDEDTSDEDIVEFIKRCPMLKHIRTNKMPDKDLLLPAILKYCFDIQSFSVEFMPTLTVPEIDALFEAFPDLYCFLVRIEGPDAIQIIDRVSKCTKLKKLTLSGQYCGDGVFKPIVDGCVSLEHLSFNGGFPNISEKDLLYVLHNMKERLSYLQFGFSPTTQQIVNLLGNFTKLSELSLHDATHDRVVDFEPLTKIKTLRSLKFEFFGSESNELDRFLSVLFGQPFPKLERLAMLFFHCNYDKTIFKKIGLCYPNLKYLRLFGKHPDDVRDGFKDVCCLEGLETLIFSSSDKITDEDIEHLQTCHKLRNVDLSFNRLLTDNAIIHLTKCKNLRTVNLSCSLLTGKNFHCIAEHLKMLKVLDVRQCMNLDENCVRALTDALPGLKVIQDGSVCFA